MPKFIQETNSVFCIDETYIDSNEISMISEIQPQTFDAAACKDAYSDKPHFFSIMFKGHSNITHIKADNELGAELKRRFIIESWCCRNMYAIPEFDLTTAFEQYEAEIAQMNEEDDDPDID